MSGISAHRGAVFHYRDDATLLNTEQSHEFFADGLLIIEDGKVVAAGPAKDLLDRVPGNVEPVNHGNRLIVPGFVDAHAHAPQTAAIGAYGEQLLEWLHGYIFPSEARFADPAYARAGIAFFLDELLRNGTTTAAIFSSSHRVATDILFEEAQQRSMRIIAGKMLMDRNAAEELLDSPESAYEDSKKLIEKWNGRDRLLYAITPRFAPTSTSAELESAGRLMQEYPDLYMQTHLAENLREVELVHKLFPDTKDYLDVYDRYGLLGRRSIFGHSIHLSDREFARIAETGSVACWCPTSNFFLGSGIFDYARAKRMEAMVAMGTDVSAGTSFSMLATLNEAYKGSAVRAETKLSALDAFYLITFGAARALSLQDRIGNFVSGKEADFLVLDLECTPLMRYRMDHTETLAERLFVLMMLGDDRCVARTYVAGREWVPK
jgi:guanine deaminase